MCPAVRRGGRSCLCGDDGPSVDRVSLRDGYWCVGATGREACTARSGVALRPRDAVAVPARRTADVRGRFALALPLGSRNGCSRNIQRRGLRPDLCVYLRKKGLFQICIPQFIPQLVCTASPHALPRSDPHLNISEHFPSNTLAHGYTDRQRGVDEIRRVGFRVRALRESAPPGILRPAIEAGYPRHVDIHSSTGTSSGDRAGCARGASCCPSSPGWARVPHREAGNGTAVPEPQRALPALCGWRSPDGETGQSHSYPLNAVVRYAKHLRRGSP